MPRKRKSKQRASSGMTRIVVGRGPVDVSGVLEDGTIVSLEMGRWRAEQRNRPEDVGLEDVDVTKLQEYMKLGSKTLIPPVLQKKMKSIESSARYSVIKYSLDTPFGRFVPNAAYPALDAAMDRYEKEWFAMRDEIVAHMKKNQQEVRASYNDIARQVYEQFRRQDGKKERYARRFAGRIIKAIPSVEEISAQFRYEFHVGDVPNVTALKARVRQQILSEETASEKIKTVREAEEAKRMAQRLRLERWEKKKDDQVDQFLHGVNRQVRTMVGEVASAAAQSLKNNHRLIGKTSTQLKGMIARFRMLNVLNDKEIEKQLNTVEALMQQDRTGKNKEFSLTNALTALASEARNVALNLKAAQPRSVREDLLADMDDEQPLFGMQDHVRAVRHV